MFKESFEWSMRIRTVEREYMTARLAMDRLDLHARDNPAVLTDNLRVRDIAIAAGKLEGTYIIRLFAEFETALRQFMKALGYPVPKTAEALLNRVKDRAGIPKEDLANAHGVREYRNTLLHHRQQPVRVISVRDATRHLGCFIGWLQGFW